jgi:hypothetical protein
MGCGLKTRRSYGSWPDRHPWAAAALGVPARIVGLAVVAAYPLVFVPLLVMVGVALAAAAGYEETSYCIRDPTCWRADCPDMRWKAQGAPGDREGRASLLPARST